MNHISKKSWSLSLLLLVMIAIVFVFTFSALAGDEDGTGGGQNVPLGLASSTPADGQTGVGLQPEIKLIFNKNVINLAIRDANKNCFALVSSAGVKVPIEVIMADDQIYPEEKRNVSLKPLQALKANCTYTVKISPQLQAKNGTSLGHEITIKFTTIGAPAETVKPTPTVPAAPPTVEKQPEQSKANQPTSVMETSSADKPQTAVQEKNKETITPDAVSASKIQNGNEQTESSNLQKQQHAYLWWTSAGLALLAVLGYLVYRKRNHK